MQIVTLDFETFWSQTHSLTKMSPVAYVLHPDTEIISCALKVAGQPTEVHFGFDDIKAALDRIDWARTLVVGHNMSGFDAMILAWRFGIDPHMWGCTLAMARPRHSAQAGGSLARLVEHYGLGTKDNTALLITKGRRLAEFTPEERAAMARYNATDTEQCFALFRIFARETSPREMWHIDATVRMLVKPAFWLDADRMDAALAAERTQKRLAMMSLAQQLNIPPGDPDVTAERLRTVLASAPKFSALLTMLGADTPTKPSPTDPDKSIPALAKTDAGFIALQEHENLLVAAAAMARLEVKSTLLETRIQSMLEAAEPLDGMLPVPLRYCGAGTTGRWSGDMFNCQNFPRVSPGAPKNSDALRMSLRAPDGMAVVVADLSGIEMRVNHTLWRVPYSTAMWADDPTADIYRATAARYYQCEPAAVTKPQRQFGKVLQLGCGFGVGAAKFLDVARTMGRLALTEDEARAGVYGWRGMHPEITDGWRTCQDALVDIAAGRTRALDPKGLLTTEQDAIRLPSGRRIHYPGLHSSRNERGQLEWSYGQGRNKAYIYGGKMDENVVQALARDIFADVIYSVWLQTGKRPAMHVHDEVIYIVPEEDAAAHLAVVQDTMRRSPGWWPELTTWSEGDVAQTYGEAK